MAPRKINLTHVAPNGRSRMVDVGDKPATKRRAVAAGRIEISPEAMELVRRRGLEKGDAIETARLAGILAAKKTADLIPLCHPLPLDHVDVQVTDIGVGFEIVARVLSTGRTGAEMEALTAVSVAALTLYDMVKAADRSMVITRIRLLEKSGGRRGRYVRNEGPPERG